MILRILIACGCCLAAAEAEAQMPLRWRLAPGDAYRVRIEQTTQSTVSFSGKRAVTKIELVLGLNWQVSEAGEGVMRIRQSIASLQMKLSPETGEPVAFDSDKETRATGAARDLDAALRPLVGAEVLITMTDRGAVTAVEPVNEAARSLFAKASEEQSAVSRTTVQQLLKQSLIAFPERELTPGDKWDSSADLSSALGAYRQVASYVLEEPVERDGKTLAQIRVTTRLEPAAADAPRPAADGAPAKPQASIKSHEHTGVVLFDAAAGRVVEAESNQKLVTEKPFRETTIVVALESQQRAVIEPAGEN